MKSKPVAYIFFCLFGMHYLYLGKIQTQIAFWLSFGGLGVWAFIDLFRIPHLVDNYNNSRIFDPDAIFNRIVFFESKSNNYIPRVGESLNLWNKPNTSLIYAYEPGTYGGDGLLGIANNRKLSRLFARKDTVYMNQVMRSDKFGFTMQVIISPRNTPNETT